MIYQFKCKKCGFEIELVRKVDDRDAVVHCGDCATPLERVPSFVGGLKTEHPSWLFHRDVEGSLGRKFDTRKEHDKFLKENNFIQR